MPFCNLKKAEILNGRLAMIGVIIMILTSFT
ncbi:MULTISPECIES: chlorophyll a/b-binding protein [Prochlorococcus]|uniref:High light inducible protein hli3 n=1 Tax=Prochlorococcus marinus (strain SARG / CCMP1375 / SS120) TaxID=167539 RepID=Q7VA98_PROMA|nr:High light inducible protein hli3 [Prochlorococcus marinus subsp. marinus str. CCMP1375]